MAIKINDEVLAVLKKCTVNGFVVTLPAGQLDRKLYQEVAKHLQHIGGKWKGNKIQGFVFEQDPASLLAGLQDGDGNNIKKEFQFFATPAHLAKRLVDLADVTNYQRILEPSAGQGAIINAINQRCDVFVEYCELMPLNRQILEQNFKAAVIGHDFMAPEILELPKYDRIIANPPFAKNQDIEHIRRMYSLLNRNGRIVTIASKHWLLSGNKKETDFKNWLDNDVIDYRRIDLEPGEFTESGTMISACILIIDK